MIRLPLLLAAALSLVTGSAQAAGGIETPAGAEPELARIWAEFCVDRFPDEARVNALAQLRAAKPLTSAEIESYLHADPGHGWYLKTPLGLYAITIEDPPIRACAARRMTPSGVSTVADFNATVKAFARAHSGALVGVPPQHQRRPNGIDISGYGQSMTNLHGQVTNVFAVVLSNYHGRAPEPWRLDAMDGVGVEVRFVHQMPQ